MPFQYDRGRRRLWVNCPHVDLWELQSLIQQAYREELLPKLDAIICTRSSVTLIMRGPYLDHWIAVGGFEVRDVS